ncbi:MAG TPA: AAA family ATPase [Acidimicrobiales bacterium]|nr:AAA family ATPase [Acidimicrobiales bacterium]
MAVPLQDLLERDGPRFALETALGRAHEGKRASVFVVGEAGLGKSVLLDMAVEEALQLGFEVARAYGEATQMALPFGYISQLFPDWEADEVLSFVPALPPGERAGAAWQRLQAWSSRRREVPLLLALDDLHWADRDSLMLLGLLARQRSQSRLAIVGTQRPWPDEASAMARALTTSRQAETLSLQPLSQAASIELVTRLAGPETARELAPALGELCAGNPLLLHELCAGAASGLPALNSHGILISRFTGLSAAGMDYARAAAVSGVQFRPSVAGAVAGLGPVEARRSLDDLCRSGLVEGGEGGKAAFTHALLRQALYDDLPEPLRAELHAETFAHLLREHAPVGEVAAHALAAHLRGEAAVRSLAQAGTDALHGGALQAAIGWFEAALELGRDDCPPEVHLRLAEALDGAGAAGKAAEVCRRALDNSAHLDQVTIASLQRLLGRALFQMGHWDEAEESFEKAAGNALAADCELATQILLEASLLTLYGPGVRRSLFFAERAGDLLVPGSDAQLSAWVRAARGHARSLMADPSGAEEVRAAMASLPSGTGMRGLNGASVWGPRMIQLQTAKQAERFDEAVAAYEMAIKEAKASPLRFSDGIYAVAHADTVARLGRIAESRDILLAADDDSPWFATRRPWAHVGLAYTNYELADFAQAAHYCEKVEGAIGEGDATVPLLRFWLWYVRSGLHLAAGDMASAARLAERAEAGAEACGVAEPCFPWHSAAIQAYLAAGRFTDAERCVARLERHCEQVPCRWPRTVAARGRAQLAELSGDHETASQWFEQACEWQRDLPMPLVKAETLIRYGAFLRRRRLSAQARQVLGQAVNITLACGARRLEMAATEELHLSGGRRRYRQGTTPGQPGWDNRITPAQRRVAALAAEGLTNEEIGRRLFISARTVEHHLSSVYAALGLSGRRQLRASDPRGPSGP